MTIEIMKIQDYNEIYDLWVQTEGITLRSIDDSEDGIHKFLKRNPGNSFVCRINNEIVGTILCGHDGRKGFIYHTVVKKEYRNKGIGKKLVSSSIDSLRQEDITKVAVLINENNELGNRFWESGGFLLDNDLIYRLLPLNANNT